MQDIVMMAAMPSSAMVMKMTTIITSILDGAVAPMATMFWQPATVIPM